eukprot:11852_5
MTLRSQSHYQSLAKSGFEANTSSYQNSKCKTLGQRNWISLCSRQVQSVLMMKILLFSRHLQSTCETRSIRSTPSSSIRCTDLV